MKRILSTTIMLFLLLQVAPVVPVYGKSGPSPEKVRAKILKLGTGRDAQVKVKLKSGKKVEGFIATANDSEFVVENPKTGEQTAVTYPAAKQVRGNNLSSGVKILIGVGIFLAVVLLVVPLTMD